MDDVQKQYDLYSQLYADRFDDSFPIMVLHCSYEKAIEIMRECLEKGEPYEYEDDGTWNS